MDAQEESSDGETEIKRSRTSKLDGETEIKQDKTPKPDGGLDMMD